MTQTTIISADSHVFEPIDLWEKRLDRKFRERGPRFVSEYQGKAGTWFVCEGINPRSIASIAATGVAKEDLVKFKDVHHKDLRPGGYDPVARLKDQDIDGVSAEVLYATYAMQLYCMPDAELQEAAFNAYNEWLVEMCSRGARPARGARADLGVQRRSCGKGAGALDEARIARRDDRRAFRRKAPSTASSSYDPFWAAAEELGVPISIHTLTSNRTRELSIQRARNEGRRAIRKSRWK